MRSQILSVLVLLLITSVCLAVIGRPPHTCASGQYRQRRDQSYFCVTCESGNYCPGDGSKHQCEGDTYSNRGASKCVSCVNSRAAPSHKFCLLPDTPSDV